MVSSCFGVLTLSRCRVSLIQLLFQKDLNVHHKFGILIMAFKNILCKDWVVSVRHSLHEGNVVADYLAKKGALSDSGLESYLF